MKKIPKGKFSFSISIDKSDRRIKVNADCLRLIEFSKVSDQFGQYYQKGIRIIKRSII